jgi:hypothetical protein
MTKIRLCGLDAATIGRIRADTHRRKVSVNQRINEVLRMRFAAGACVFDDLDELAGTWSKAEAAAFESAIAPLTQIEPMSGSSSKRRSR